LMCRSSTLGRLEANSGKIFFLKFFVRDSSSNVGICHRYRNQKK
jgi:hypothetical protein